MHIAFKTWENISKFFIQNCFINSGFSKEISFELCVDQPLNIECFWSRLPCNGENSVTFEEYTQ